MSRVKTNFLANLAGSGWTAIVGLACTPLYIHFMGMEAYGLIGFYYMLQGVIQILDLGLSPTMNREMARYSVIPDKAGEARNFVRTLEAGYWAVGILIGCTVYFAAPYIATNWIKAGEISAGEVRRAVAIMGVLAALQWPLSLYQGGLLGLQRHVLFNGISIATATLSGGGALLILWFVSPTVSAFFIWQVVIAFLQTIGTTIALWRCLPVSGNRPRFEPGLLRSTLHFTAGMGGITLSAIILTQLDKAILSKLLDLKTFGYYMLACVVVNGISTVLITPMFNTVFPRFSALVAAKDEKGLTEMYHGSTQIMAVLILPVAAVLAFFSEEVMMLWTQNAEVTRNTAPIVSILVAGTALNGMINMPYALQLAHGWTRLAFIITTVYIFTLGPAIVFLTVHYGAIGAASAWFALNVVHVAIMIPFTHRRLLTGESRRWYFEDFGPPLLGVLLVCTVGRTILSGPMGPHQLVINLFILLLATIVVSALTVPAGRHFLIFWRNTSNVE